MLSNVRGSAPVSVPPAAPRATGKNLAADWNAYAAAYALLSLHNPAYRALMDGFARFLETIEAPRTILDIGGGTGTYTEIAARRFPGAELCLVEPDAGMRALAQAKLRGQGNVRFDDRGLQDFDAPASADLVICVHALYAMPEQARRLHDLRRQLRPGGWLYLVDLGRPMDVADWRGYLFADLRRKHGLLGALRIFWQGREIARQNRIIREAQDSGTYWTHSGAELAELAAAAGFEIVRQDVVYRGYSDLLVCRARP